jgi:hypothetical protein
MNKLTKLPTKMLIYVSTMQVLSFFFRPDKDSKIRRYWNWFHHWVGRLTLFFAAVNIVYGIHVAQAGNSWKAGYGVVLSLILITTIALETLFHTKWSQKTVNPPSY